MLEDFADFIALQRERLTAERDGLITQQNGLDQQLDAVNREFAAIEAYEAAKMGKAAARAPASEARPRAPRGAWRQAIVQAVSETSSGMTRGELLNALGLKGDKTGEMAISTALTAMTKAGQLVREGGRYKLPANPSSFDEDDGDHVRREAAE